MESAGITLVKGDLRGIVRARRLRRATRSNIRQNFFCFHLQGTGVPIVFCTVLRPVAITHDRRCGHELQLGVSVGNALRLWRVQP